MAHDWLLKSIVEGFQRLITLRLQNCPPEDALEATVQVWYETLRFRLKDLEEKQDRIRIERAFLKLCADCEWFPNPKMLLERMPPRELKALPDLAPISEEQRQKNLEYIRKIKEGIKNAYRRA